MVKTKEVRRGRGRPRHVAVQTPSTLANESDSAIEIKLRQLAEAKKTLKTIVAKVEEGLHPTTKAPKLVWYAKIFGSKKQARPESAKPKDGVKRSGGRRWWLVPFGLACLVIALFAASLWGSHRENAVLAFGFVVGFPAGLYVIYLGIKPREEAITLRSSHKGPANSLNIYAGKSPLTGNITPSRIAFEQVENPLGHPQQCTNDGKWYYVHIADILTGTLNPFELPDSQYFDPREFANVIMMPAHRRLFERKVSLLQRIAPAIMVVAFLIAVIGFIATSPASK